MTTTPLAASSAYLTMFSDAKASPNAVKYWARITGTGASAPTVTLAGGVIASITRTDVGQYRVTLSKRPTVDASGVPLCFPVVQFLDGGGTNPAGWTAVITTPANTTLAGLTATRMFLNVFDDTDTLADLPVDVMIQFEITLVVGDA